MSFLRTISPLRAIRDLRVFLASRKPYELWFMMLALVITFTVLFVFVKDSHIETPYKREIIYVEQWPITRTDAQIREQQKIDEAKRTIARAELEKRRQKKQAEFKKVDDWLTRHGF